MARPAPKEFDEDTVTVPGSVWFPVELEPPEGFDPARLETWPRVEGSLEWVAGRLLYMPPCARFQRVTVTDVVAVLARWRRSHPEFEVGTNEAGVWLGEDIRGADAAVWLRAHLDPKDRGLAKAPPVLAVEVRGRRESARAFRDKARWYCEKGVQVVWLVLPQTREVVVLTTGGGERRLRKGNRVPPHPALPDLTPRVDEFFVQLDR